MAPLYEGLRDALAEVLEGFDDEALAVIASAFEASANAQTREAHRLADGT